MFGGIFEKSAWQCPYLCRVTCWLPKVIFPLEPKSWFETICLCVWELLEQVGDGWSSHCACWNSYLEIWLASAAQASAVQIHRAICTWRGNWAGRRSGPVSVFSQKDCSWTDVLWCFSQKMDSGERKCLSITEVLCITAIFNLESESLKVLDKILSTVTTFFVSSRMQPGVICKVPIVRLWGDLSAGETEFSPQPGIPEANASTSSKVCCLENCCCLLCLFFQ